MHKIGLVGCGKWSEIVINEINKSNKFVLKAIVCRKNISLPNKNKNLIVYDKIEKMINSKSVDCIYIAANPSLNYNAINLIKDKKIPIILEKPLVDSYEKSLEIINEAVNKKNLTFTNLPNIYSENFNRIKKFIKENKKDIKKIIVYEGDFGPFRDNIHPIWDWGFHSISMILKLFDNHQFTNINMIELKKNNKFGRGLVSKFIFSLSSNVEGKIITGNLFNKKIRKIKIILKNKDYLLANMNDHNIYFKKTLLFKGRKTPLNLLLETFHDRIKNGYQKEDLNNIFISSETIKIIEKFYRC